MENMCGFHYSEHSSTAPPPLLETSLNFISSDLQFVRSLSSSSSSSDEVLSNAVFQQQQQEQKDVDVSLRAKVASHPLFPQLLHAYIDCHKVGAPPEIAQLLDEMTRGENGGVCHISTFFGADPELDDFMETYLNLLVKYKSDISKPFEEATTFLKDMETQLNSICNSVPNISDEVFGASKKELSVEDKEAIESKRINEDQELKDNLLRRYSGHISNLKHELSKTQKNKKMLSEEAKQILLAWWNIHFKWPYPTDEDKVALAEWTSLDQKQVNNWFINQRKRHWKPTKEMQTILEGLYGPFLNE